MRVGYIRVSTSEQNTERQKMVLAKYNIEKFFEEKRSGKNTQRKKLEEMRNFVREGDVVYVSELARLARNLSDLLVITKEFQEKGVQLVSDKENIDTSSATGRLVFHMIASLAEFERDLIRERQAEGIAAAREQGKPLGRPRVAFSEEKFNELYGLYQKRLVTAVSMSKQLGVSTATLYRLLAQRKKKDIKEI